MKTTLFMKGKPVAIEQPRPTDPAVKALFVPCPHCNIMPIHVKANPSKSKKELDTITAAAYCSSCQQAVGKLVIKLDEDVFIRSDHVQQG